MTDDERLALKPGDRVLVQDDVGTRAEWTVKYSPWQCRDGTWVIGLQGMVGGYLLSRVVELIESPSRIKTERDALKAERDRLRDAGDGILRHLELSYSDGPISNPAYWKMLVDRMTEAGFVSKKEGE